MQIVQTMWAPAAGVGAAEQCGKQLSHSSHSADRAQDRSRWSREMLWSNNYVSDGPRVRVCMQPCVT